MANSTEGVIIIRDGHDEPIIMITKNGHVRWFKLEEMSFQDFSEYLQADGVQNGAGYKLPGQEQVQISLDKLKIRP